MKTVSIGGTAMGLNAALLHKPSAAAIEKQSISSTVNRQVYHLEVGNQPDEVAPSHTLVQTLRDTLKLTGTKTPCNKGECGGCTVIMDGVTVLACSTLILDCDGKKITTIEGVSDRKTGRLHPVQQAFIHNDAIQCGFCTPGMVLSSKALLDQNSSPTEEEIREALSGNLCRCTGYVKYVEAVQRAAESMKGP